MVDAGNASEHSVKVGPFTTSVPPQPASGTGVVPAFNSFRNELLIRARGALLQTTMERSHGDHRLRRVVRPPQMNEDAMKSLESET